MGIHNLINFSGLLISLCWLLMYGWLHRQQTYLLKDAMFWVLLWLFASLLITFFRFTTFTLSPTIPENSGPFLISGLILFSTLGRISKKGSILFLFLWISFIYLPISSVINFYLAEMHPGIFYWTIINGVAGFTALALLLFTPPLSEFRQFKPCQPLYFILPTMLSVASLLLMPKGGQVLLVWVIWANVLLGFLHFFFRKVPSVLPAEMTAFLLIFAPLATGTFEILTIIVLAAIFSFSFLKLHPMQADTAFWVCAIHGSAGYLASVLYLLVSPMAEKFTLFLAVHAAFAWSLMTSYMLLSLINRVFQARK